MDRRRERRLNLELPVRIWGVDRTARPFAEIVRVGNVSNGGAVLIGVRSKVQTGICWMCNWAPRGRSFASCG